MKKDPITLMPAHIFLKRLTRNILIGLLITFVALGIGMMGYHSIEGMPWVDAFENAAMILSGMGPVYDLKTSAGKIFAGCYAIFSGTLFLVIIAIVFAPVIKRALHTFHIDDPK